MLEANRVLPIASVFERDHLRRRDLLERNPPKRDVHNYQFRSMFASLESLRNGSRSASSTSLAFPDRCRQQLDLESRRVFAPASPV